MDFTWVAQDDSNAIQNTIVDAKGDLISATGSDVPARLAVGANDLILTAASGEATGLKWSGGRTSWTPTFTGLTVGNGTVVAEYQQFGKVVFFYIQFTLGSTSVVTGDVYFSLPVGTAHRGLYNGTAYYLDAGVQTAGGTFEFSGSNAFFRLSRATGTWVEYPYVLSATTPWVWGTNDLLAGYSWYEVA